MDYVLTSARLLNTTSHEEANSRGVGWVTREWDGLGWLSGRSQRVVISGTGSRCPPGFYTGPSIFNLFVSYLAEGPAVSSVSLLMTQGWEEWPVPQRAV